ncbi:hypothetical protein RHGRI_005830 [Rhododendron griersonianum]|uniref:phospholipid-hydroperoxide glutathione peroxidase n=1 Tax=Rhododendron griersonianum TaxID=479676 RepID=A0AAV6LDL6_9ERIC|nr:hypothetical protein RHGRI_005830 [Rhododendron griersonianum]KAG5563200.1 hypothetical protein RHGRI_005830 [Rhododendron griersonianum]
MKSTQSKSFDSIPAKFMSRVVAVLLLVVLAFLWFSTTTIISGDIVHVCVSSRKLNNPNCLSAGTQTPDFEIPIIPPLIQNTSISHLSYLDSKQEVDDPVGHVGEVKEYAVRVVEEQIQLHRSWASNARQANCSGGGIYVYELPPKFNKDLMGQCADMVPWLHLCKYLINEALGEPIPELGEGWYKTHQYSLEPIFHSRVLKHPCRVHDENEANLFYVPYYGGLDVLRWHFKNVSDEVKDSLALDLVKWLEPQKSWARNSGKDHVFVLGKISWDFRRDPNSSWGTKFLELDRFQNPIKLLIERHPWHVNDISIPHPTHFHPHSDHDIVALQLKLIRLDRKTLVSFAGAARPGAPENIRSKLIEQCNSVDTQKCRVLDCSSGGCDQPKTVIDLFMESEFCLQPPGDSPTRKSVFDSIISGCIPVLFDPFTAYYQYPWHLPEDRGKYSVFIDQEEVREMKDAKGNDVDLSIYKGKVLLIVNVASQCGLTNSNYTELSKLYEKYKDQGLEILAFPCNQFGGQEPGDNEQIMQFACTRFKAEFPIFDKVDVNGQNAAPLYKFLKSSKGGFLGDSIKWNFSKFLVDKEGNVVDRFAPTTSPLSIEKKIKKLLGIS